MGGSRIGRAAWAARTFGFHAAYNALMRAAPGVAQGLQRLTRDTGRAGTCVGPATAEYFRSVADDFETIARHAGVTAPESGGPGSPLYAGRTVLELGPGDTMGVSLVARLRGARACAGFDAFDIASRDRAYLEAIYGPIAQAEGPANISDVWALLEQCPHVVGAAELRRGGRRFDLVLSRAVLEHVKDLEALFSIAREVSTEDAVWVHEVDLRDHGIKHAHPLDFLRFAEGTWRTMTSHTDALEELPTDIEFIDLKCSRVRYALPKIIRLIWQGKPDVVFSTLGHLNLALAMFRGLFPPQVRLIARETTVVSQGLQEYSQPGAWALAYRRFYGRMDRLHASVKCSASKHA